MKNIFWILGVFSCLAYSKPDGFIVRGKIEGYQGSMLFVREMTPDNEVWVNDTLTITDGKFIYQGKVESPRLIYFIPQNYQGRYELFLDNSEIELLAKNGDFKNVTVKGSASHDEFIRLLDKSADLQRGFNLYEYRKKQASKDNKELSQQLSDSAEIWTSRFLTFLMGQPNYPESMVLPYFAGEWIKTHNTVDMERFLSGLTEPARNGVYASYASKTVAQAKKVLPGSPAYDFTLQDTSGNVYHLSDFKGEYVLLEFSASWCGWCKLEIPYLKKVYEITRGKKFRIFTINLDKERKLWVEDVAKENLPWPVISDLKAFEHGVAEEYNVSGIPVIFLIDPEGKIVTDGLRGEKMIEQVSKIVNN